MHTNTKSGLLAIRSLLAALLIALGCPATGYAAAAAPETPLLIPWPRTITVTPGSMPLASTSRIVTADPTLLPLVRILAYEILVNPQSQPSSTR